MSRRLTAAVSLVALSLPAAARAQSTIDQLSSPSTRPVQIGLGGGVSVPRQGATARELQAGMQGQGFVLFRLPAGLPALRLNVDYARQKFERPTRSLVGSPLPGGVLDTASAERTALAGIAGLRFDLLRGPVRPYVVAGVGAFSVTDAVEEAGRTRDYSNVNFGLDGGAGLAIRLGPVGGFVEARLQNVYTKREGLIDTKSIQSVPVTFGLVF